MDKFASFMSNWAKTLILVATMIFTMGAGWTQVSKNTEKIKEVDIDGCAPSIKVRARLDVMQVRQEHAIETIEDMKITMEKLNDTLDRVVVELAKINAKQ